MNLIKKILKMIVLMVLTIAIVCVTIDQFVALSASRYINKKNMPKTDVILVLGAHVTPQKEPSAMLAERLDAAIKAYEEGVAGRILVSGDHDSIYYNEVGVMKAYLVENGIPEKKIIMDHAGFSTYESMVRAKAIFGIDSLVISTQGYHLKRAVYIARALGMEAYGIKADKEFQLKVYALKYRPREFLARIKDFVYVHIVRPEPTCLGEPVSINYSDPIS